MSSSLPLIDDYRSLVTQKRPLIDLRAPVEFARGSLPGTVNLPLLTDKEREAVGTAYKREGNAAAVALGHRIVSGTVKAERIAAWIDYILYAQREYDEAHARGEAPYDWVETMRHNFRRIHKRLGNERYTRFLEMLESAWNYQQDTGDPARHKEWIEALLIEYYDPMYDWQIENKKERIVFRGDRRAVLEYLKSVPSY